ncbi:MAG TPA: hypothetical protein VGR28_06780 [Candidatus Thermoplasmatota archaeon]|nr:hypothetical protein [Candidatus Thermoplasmatota archaeon]
MRLLAALLLAALLAPPVMGIAVDDPGDRILEGTATDLVERRLVLDLWDEGDARRGFTLRPAPDGDPLAGLEARARAIQVAEGAWKPLAAFHLNATGGKSTSDRGWDGLYELSVRARLPNQARATLALLLVEDAPGADALAMTTVLQARTLELRAWAELGSEGPRVRASLVGPKQPSGIEALAGAQPWPLVQGPEGWSAPWPAGAARVRVQARFADGGLLAGPEVARPPDGPALGAPVPADAPAPPTMRDPADSAVPPSEAPPAGSPLAPARADAPSEERTGLRPAGLERSLPAAPISLAFALAAGAALLWRRRRPPIL